VEIENICSVDLLVPLFIYFLLLFHSTRRVYVLLGSFIAIHSEVRSLLNDSYFSGELK